MGSTCPWSKPTGCWQTVAEHAPPDLVWWRETGVPPSISQSLEVRLLHEEQTDFQRIRIFDHDALGRVLVLDDVVQTTQADEFYYHELLAHVALNGLASDEGGRRVLIIGGGDGGLLREVLLYEDVRRVDLVEIDVRVIELSQRYLALGGDFEDRRVRTCIADANDFLAEPVQPPGYDIVFLDAPDPVGPGEILYSESFLRRVQRCLAPTGIVVRHLGLPAYQRDTFRRGIAAMRSVFASVDVYRGAVPTYIGGEMAFVIGAASDLCCREPLAERSGRYYNTAIHRAAFALPTWWQDAITNPEAEPCKIP